MTGSITLTTRGAFGWNIAPASYALDDATEGTEATYNLLAKCSVPSGVTPAFTVTTQSKGGVADYYGITINETTGVLTVPDTVTADDYSVVVDLDRASVEVTTLGISGAGAWTFGQAFKQGDAPAYVTIDGGQADVRNRWADGSVKFAVLSKVSSGAETVSVVTSASNDMSGSVALSSAFTTNPPQVVFSAGVTATVTCPTSDTVAAWDKATAHLVRKIEGSVMTERHYYSPVTGNNHLAVWWYVRSYSNGTTEVETVVENGWVDVASPGAFSYTAAVNIGGSTVFTSSALTHYHHTRWSRVDWYGTDPAITPTHDTAYLQQTSLVPTYAVTSLDAAGYTDKPDNGTRFSAWTQSLAERPEPFDIGNFDPAMGSGGDTDNYGIVPIWGAAYLIEGNAGAYRSVIGNARAQGRYSVHYRSESDGRPARGSQYLDYGYGSGHGISYPQYDGSASLPANSGSYNTYTFTHAPSTGFLAYLLTGRWSFMESVQLAVATAEFGHHNAQYGGYSIQPVWSEQNRGQAWMFRDMVHAEAITPATLAGSAVAGADASQRTESVGRLQAQIDYWYEYLVSGTVSNAYSSARNNAFGLPYQNADYDLYALGGTQNGLHDYGGLQTFSRIACVLYGYDATPTIAAGSMTKLGELAAFHAQFPVGMLGAATDSTLRDWRVCGFVTVPFGTGGQPNMPSATTYYASWDAQWTAMLALSWEGGSYQAPAADTNLYKVNSPTDTSYLRISSRTPMATDTDMQMFYMAMGYAHKVADQLSIDGVETAATRLYTSATWTDGVSSLMRTRPDFAVTTDRAVA